MSIRDRLKAALLAVHVPTSVQKVHDFFVAEIEKAHTEVDKIREEFAAELKALHEEVAELKARIDPPVSAAVLTVPDVVTHDAAPSAADAAADPTPVADPAPEASDGKAG